MEMTVKPCTEQSIKSWLSTDKELVDLFLAPQSFVDGET